MTFQIGLHCNWEALERCMTLWSFLVCFFFFQGSSFASFATTTQSNGSTQRNRPFPRSSTQWSNFKIKIGDWTNDDGYGTEFSWMNHGPGSAWSHLFLRRPSAFRHPLVANQAHKRQNQTPNQQQSTLLNFFQRGEEGNFHVGSQFQCNRTFQGHDRGPWMGPTIPNSHATNKASTAECAAP